MVVAGVDRITVATRRRVEGSTLVGAGDVLLGTASAVDRIMVVPGESRIDVVPNQDRDTTVLPDASPITVA